jgi:flagellar hook protein FlgE
MRRRYVGMLRARRGTPLSWRTSLAMQPASDAKRGFSGNLRGMGSVSSIALSGMNAAAVSMDSAAHNIANLNTAKFRRQEVEQASVAPAGVTTSLTQAPRVGSAPEEDMVGMLQAKNAFLANLAVFKTADSMAGSLLDMTE